MEWESCSIYSSSEAEVFGAGTVLPKSDSTSVENLPRASLTTRGLANSLPSAGTQELRHKTTWNSSERTSIQWPEQPGCLITLLSAPTCPIFLGGKLYPQEKIAAERDTVATGIN